MVGNSGFLGEDEETVSVSAAFSEAKILGRSATNLYGCVNRFGKRWFFKGVCQDAPDVAAARQRLLKEFDIQIGLVHPSVARAISFENVDGIGECIITEWIEGETLEYIIDKAPITKADRRRIFSEIVDAVSYLHSQGIVHRDLKPSNIMIRNNGQTAVVIDFGLADTDAHTYQKSPAGTEGYASPRQYETYTPYTGDDIHALGVIMQQLCPWLASIARRCRTGRYPTAEALRLAIIHRSRRRRMVSWVSATVIFISVVIALLAHINTLRNTTMTLQDNIAVMTDSLTSVNLKLDDERNIRLNQERRQAQMAELKSNLNMQLDSVFASFSKVEDPTDPENSSLIRLIDRMTKVKDNFFAREIPFALTDDESIELEYSFILHYNKILQQWNQTLSQHRPNSSN